jgi:tetratricopeptide (TPR) repeat protein
MPRSENWRSALLVCALLGGVTLALFWPVCHHDFIVYDDGQYVSENPYVASGLTWPNIVWAFSHFHSGNWHPLTWISHMVDVQLFGMRPGLQHLTNVFFHSANSVLLFLLLNLMTGAFWRSSIVAALFALHPAHVESVAWLAERKDVLSAYFFFLTLLAYVGYAKRAKIPNENPKAEAIPEFQNPKADESPVSEARKRRVYYVLTLVSFALGLLSKPMLVTVPFVLLLIDYWPLQRIPRLQGRNSEGARRVILEKVPLFALSAASCVVTYLAQKAGGAVDTLERVPFEARLSNAVVAYLHYLAKLLWPSKLAILYLRPDDWTVWEVGLGILVLVGMTFLSLCARRRYPWTPVGWLWFLGTLVPVIGLVQVGNQYMADRYTYIPYIGCFITMVWTAWELAKSSRVGRPLLAGVTLLVVSSAAALTHAQIQHWKHSEALLKHCIAVTKDNFAAHNILGVTFARQNRFEEARAQFVEALTISPQYADSLQNFGILLTEHGDFNDALSYLQQAVAVRPELSVVYCKLGLALDMKDQAEQAIIYYRECIRLRPDQQDACNNLAWLLATYPDPKFRDGAEAVRLAEHICDVTAYQKAPMIGTLAATYAEAGRFQDAIVAAEKAVAVARQAGEDSVVKRNEELLQLYRDGKPYREPRGKTSPVQ